MTLAGMQELLFIRLQTSLLCRTVQHEADKTALIDWLFEIDRSIPAPFYIVHEWCCSLEQPLRCVEEIQIVDPDGDVEAHLRMSPFLVGHRFWDTIRNYWEISNFVPGKTGTYEIRTALIDADTDNFLFQQIDPLRVV